jgi:hypothetical protein
VLLNEIEKIKDEKKKREVMKMWDSTVWACFKTYDWATFFSYVR